MITYYILTGKMLCRVLSRCSMTLRRPLLVRAFSSTPDVASIPLPSEDPNLLGKHAKKAEEKTENPETPEEAVPSNMNPKTGEINGPKGPEPTRHVLCCP